MALSPYARFGKSQIGGTVQIERRHTVTGDETIPMIAHKKLLVGYDQEIWRQIAEANEVDDLDALTSNQVLVIPSPEPSET
jgi:nucleoid-associated protein YgaU